MFEVAFKKFFMLKVVCLLLTLILKGTSVSDLSQCQIKYAFVHPCYDDVFLVLV